MPKATRLVRGKYIPVEAKSKETRDCFRIGRFVGELEGGVRCASRAAADGDLRGVQTGLWATVLGATNLRPALPDRRAELGAIRQEAQKLIKTVTGPGRPRELNPQERAAWLSGVADGVGRLSDRITRVRRFSADFCTYDEPIPKPPRPKKKKAKPKKKKAAK